MSVTTRDILGAAPVIEPATPGSYGEAPGGFRLPAATSVGAVTLQVADLERSLEYYRTTLGLAELGRDAGGAVLGAGARPLVELRERRGARPAGRGRLGLFHFAILLPDRPALGRFVQHLADLGVYAGAGDHLVSEAFYLTDPDGLGIEVYADRPRASWRRNGRELLMATDPVDVAAVVAAGGGGAWTGMPAGTTMGHVHLHVGDLALASRFYSEALGLDRIGLELPRRSLSCGWRLPPPPRHQRLGRLERASARSRPGATPRVDARAAGRRVGPERRRESRCTQDSRPRSLPRAPRPGSGIRGARR